MGKSKLILSFSLLVCITLLGSSGVLANEDELLEPEIAFAFEASADESGNIIAVWKIADDYYMYRDKYSFELNGENVRLGEPEYPVGKIKQDEFFGEIETFVGEVRITVPVERIDASTDTVSLVAHGQGCNEPIGVCYAPVSHTVDVTLPPVAAGIFPAQSVTQTENTNGNSPLDDTSSSVLELRSLLGDAPAQDEFLHPDEAFRLSITSNETGDAVLAHFDIADGYYQYRDKTAFEAIEGDARVGNYVFPEGKSKYDEYFGDTIVYYNSLDVWLPLQRTSDKPGEMTVKATYQGCAEKGICYPPIEKTLTLSLPQLIASANAAEITSAPNTLGNATESATGDKSFIAYLTLAFGTGFLLTFTPCVLPMIPILSSVIAGQGTHITKAKGGILAIAYVLGTGVTYAAIGAVAGATGDQLQAYFQNIWAIGTVSIVLVLMALSMFGLFEVQMPSALQSRLQSGTQRLHGGSIGMVFVLGLVSALIVGACVSPLLISALSIAIAKADPVLGASIMFFMALGMGVILIAIGFGAGIVLPKAGPWMKRINQVFGVMLIAVAIYILGAIPEVPVLLLWGILFVVLAVYLGATQSLPEGVGGWRYLGKGVGTVLLVWGVFALFGGFAGSRDLLNPVPLSIFAGNAPSDSETQSIASDELFIRVSSLEELDRELVAARNAGKPVMLDYYADWCVDCKRMEKNTFEEPKVNRELKNRFVLLQVDVTDPNDDATRAMKQRYNVFGPPAILFFDTDGNEKQDLRLYGYRDSVEFLEILSNV